MNKAELIVDAKATLGEGPAWDARNQLLYWIDIKEKKVFVYNPRTGTNDTIQLDQTVGAAVPRSSGGLAVALENGFHILDLPSGTLTPIVDPEDNLPENRFNDGKCDAAGRFWAGTMAADGNGASGALYCLDTDMNVKQVLNELGISNGIAWDKQNQTMYFIDTPTNQIAAFDFSLEKGTITNKRVVADFSEEDGFPDGMTIDEEGMLWIAHFAGYQVSRWNPQNGEKLESVTLPVANVTSCVFGGTDLDELFITTAREGLDHHALEEQPQAGGLFRVKTNIRGSETYFFKG
ncbi:SMP-30/gluconolaconase/LRE domain protein [Bacillus sp. M6-12]|uniref:SMP-30/gluconolactonase/LRE family protein n=1 Tax=Bacillus sp. M6-12 TaxID=2054166 RepID=UPI000C760807|nr:SMP-30/gluconolactonase/LRE family protein [Bacillus sp. M6-12]PLS18505.1 SMP-30/gluconolaconase/LRE domain protein [Bacillus sp. M6-12]